MSMRSVTLFAFAAFLFLFNGCKEKEEENLSFAKIEQGFRTVPDSTRLAVYWYWISDNISKEGVVKDLESMKAAGITRAFIGNIGVDGIEYGEHKILSESWWEIMHTAVRKATELDIEIGIFNSPGWSQSGGPWVKPNESMRYLASADMIVKGPKSLKTSLPKIGDSAEDVKVIAYPVVQGSGFSKTWNLDKKDGEVATLDMTFPTEEVIRSFSFQVNTRFKTEGELFVKDGNQYRSLKKISIDRSNPALNVGFIPFPPVSISIPEIKASSFRLVLQAPGKGKAEVKLSSEPVVERYAEKSLAKMFQTPLPLWHDYLWDKQPEVSDPSLIVDPTKIIDLTGNLSETGELTWEVPEGDWKILRTAMLTTGVTNSPASPEGTGLEIDKMSKEHVKTHFNAYIGEILRRIPEQDRKCFKVVVQDSYETGGQNWTDDMIERFEKVYGYSPVPYIPVLYGTVVGSPDLSDRFLWDLRRLVADRVAYDYVGGLREICHQHGLTTWLENYGHWGFPGEFLQYGGQSDEVSGEFWSEGSLGDIENRAASSCAHIYGKKNVWAESFTSGGPGFSRYPNRMKQRGDRFFTEGINSTLLHLFIQQPYEDRSPGMSAWFGNEFNRKNTWFSQMDVFSGYLRRANFMLQQGEYVADVAYFIGEDAPKMTGACIPELPKGYSFDYINAEILLNQASVRDGKLSLDAGMQYRVLVLPPLKTMRPELLRKIKELVNNGLVVLGPSPEYSPSLQGYPEADGEVRQLAAEVWGESTGEPRSYGKGKVFPAQYSLDKVFESLALVPDCQIQNDVPVLFIHRKAAGGDFYFLSNQSEETISFNATFRIQDKQPELWNPLTAETRMLPEYTQMKEKGTTMIPLQLQPYESAFIVFRKSTKDASGNENYPDKEVLSRMESPWVVTFEESKNGPNEPVIFTELYDWSTSKDPQIRFFSGMASYSTTFTIDNIPQEEIYADLGKVMVMAKVYLNDNYVGGVWTSPYRVNITDHLKSGENVLRVEVVNNWMNRLIGDWQLPEKERTTWTSVNQWKADSPLQSSGLLGPVEIQGYSYKLTNR